MDQADDITRFTYADDKDALLRKLLIKVVERFTGQPKLRRLYLEYQNEPESEETFWDAAIRKLALKINIEKGAMETIPAEGPAVIVSNHPFGVIDGIVICYLVGKRRPDFKILTNSVLYRAPELRPWLYPIDFTETRDAQKQNVAARREARKWLGDGGSLIIFPGGTVSTTPKPFAKTAIDPHWQPFAASLVQKANAPVVPFFFNGQNSRLFQMASHFSQTLRVSLLFREVAEKIGDEINIRIGDLIPPGDITTFKDRSELAAFLRDATYRLADKPAPSPTKKLEAIAAKRIKTTQR